jgi:hypothetical protein
MVAAVVGFFVLLLLLLVAGALMYAALPERWRHLPDFGTRGLRGDLRRALGRWELSDIERYALGRVQSAAQITMRSAYLPNRVIVRLAPEDLDRFRPLATRLTESLAERIEVLRGCPAGGRGGALYELLGSVQVDISEDVKIAPGTADVRASFVADTVILATARGSSSKSITPRQHLASTPRWLITSPDGVRQLDGVIVVGRDRACQITIKDRRVSSRHARLWVDGERIEIEDLGSTNGTRVNGTRIASRQKLSSGDLISFGGAPALRLAWDCPTVVC